MPTQKRVILLKKIYFSNLNITKWQPNNLKIICIYTFMLFLLPYSHHIIFVSFAVLVILLSMWPISILLLQNIMIFFFPVVSFILSFIFTPLPAFNNSFVCGNSMKGHKISWHVSQSIWCVPFTMNVHSLWQGSWCWCPNWEISLRIFSFRVHIFPFWLRFKNKLYSMQIVKISTSLKYS